MNAQEILGGSHEHYNLRFPNSWFSKLMKSSTNIMIGKDCSRPFNDWLLSLETFRNTWLVISGQWQAGLLDGLQLHQQDLGKLALADSITVIEDSGDREELIFIGND